MHVYVHVYAHGALRVCMCVYTMYMFICTFTAVNTRDTEPYTRDVTAISIPI